MKFQNIILRSGMTSSAAPTIGGVKKPTFIMVLSTFFFSVSMNGFGVDAFYSVTTVREGLSSGPTRGQNEHLEEANANQGSRNGAASGGAGDAEMAESGTTSLDNLQKGIKGIPEVSSFLDELSSSLDTIKDSVDSSDKNDMNTDQNDMNTDQNDMSAKSVFSSSEQRPFLRGGRPMVVRSSPIVAARPVYPARPMVAARPVVVTRPGIVYRPRTVIYRPRPYVYVRPSYPIVVGAPLPYRPLYENDRYYLLPEVRENPIGTRREFNGTIYEVMEAGSDPRPGMNGFQPVRPQNPSDIFHHPNFNNNFDYEYGEYYYEDGTTKATPNDGRQGSYDRDLGFYYGNGRVLENTLDQTKNDVMINNNNPNLRATATASVLEIETRAAAEPPKPATPGKLVDEFFIKGDKNDRGVQPIYSWDGRSGVQVKAGLSKGAMAGIIVGAVLIIVLIIIMIWACSRDRGTVYYMEDPCVYDSPGIVYIPDYPPPVVVNDPYYSPVIVADPYSPVVVDVGPDVIIY